MSLPACCLVITAQSANSTRAAHNDKLSAFFFLNFVQMIVQAATVTGNVPIIKLSPLSHRGFEVPFKRKSISPLVTSCLVQTEVFVLWWKMGWERVSLNNNSTETLSFHSVFSPLSEQIISSIIWGHTLSLQMQTSGCLLKTVHSCTHVHCHTQTWLYKFPYIPL